VRVFEKTFGGAIGEGRSAAEVGVMMRGWGVFRELQERSQRFRQLRAENRGVPYVREWRNPRGLVRGGGIFLMNFR
jgi:hypothetical protein